MALFDKEERCLEQSTSSARIDVFHRRNGAVAGLTPGKQAVHPMASRMTMKSTPLREVHDFIHRAPVAPGLLNQLGKALEALA
jgi:hypothetical protein